MTEKRRPPIQDTALPELPAYTQEQIIDALSIKLLSKRDDKQVELVEDKQGAKFIRRIYSPSALQSFIQPDMDFQSSFDSLYKDFHTAGLKVVPSRIINPKRTKDQPLLVICQYLENAKPVKDASTKSKTELAAGLGKLLTQQGSIIPSIQMLREDMFHVIKTQAGEKIILTDIDPYVADKKALERNPKNKDEINALYIQEVASLFFHKWCKGNEREKVIGRFMGSLEALWSQAPGYQTLLAVNNLNLMKNGIDTKFK